MTDAATRDVRDPRALTGLLCAVLFIGGLWLVGLLATTGIPRPNVEPTETQQYFLEESSVVQLDALVKVMAALALAVFAGSFAGLVRRVQPESSGMAETVVGAGTLAAAFLTLSALLAGTLGTEQISDSPATVSALRQLDFFLGGATHTAALGIMTLVGSLAARRARALPDWLTMAGLVSGTISILSLVSLIADAYPAFGWTAFFIPVGRFGALPIIAVMGVLMATGRTSPHGSRRSVGMSVLGGICAVVAAFAITIFI